jgi:hypothetical protein
MKKIIVIFIVVLITNVLFTACDEEFLDTYPTDQISSSTVVQTTGNAMNSLNGVHRALYIRYGSQGRGGIGAFYFHMDEACEDHVFNSATWTTHVRWIANGSPTDAYNTSIWQMYYQWIANVNVLINGIDGAEGTIAEINAIKGQSLLYRAWAHYQLVQLYGSRYIKGGNNSQLGIPIKLDNATGPIARSTVEEVYTQINQDIDDAIVLLAGYVAPNKSNLNQSVAKGLKARVALTQGNWGVAVTYAKQAREGYPLMDQATYAAGFQIFSETNPEFMWASQIVADQSDLFGNYGAYISRNFSSSTIRSNPRSISNLLYAQISATDVRKTLWSPSGLHPGIELVSNASKYPYTNQKFIAVSTSDSRVDVPNMRSGEMYLIEAEALARDGKFDLAAQALYPFAKNRDNAYVLSTKTGAALIDEIMVQRRVDLWGEGFRWSDLKRLNLPMDRNGTNAKSTIVGGVMFVAADDNRWTYPIPQDEMDSNPLMVQNPI